MQKIIASYLVQKKECSLPGIGQFKMSARPARLDVASKELFPSFDEVIFNEEEIHLRKDLVNYISVQQNVGEDDAADRINNWCLDTLRQLDAGESVYLQSLGSLKKNETGSLFFHNSHEYLLYDILPAERVIHKDEHHAVLVGDKETTSSAMNEFYNSDVVVKKKAWWKIWAIVLSCVSLLILIIHFASHSFSTPGLGNQIHLSPQPAPTLHSASS